MNTAFLSVVAILAITGIMWTCYAWGYAEGAKNGRAEADIENCRIIIEKVARNLEEHGDEFLEKYCAEHDRIYEMTCADLEAYEQETKQKEQKEQK